MGVEVEGGVLSIAMPRNNLQVYPCPCPWLYYYRPAKAIATLSMHKLHSATVTNTNLIDIVSEIIILSSTDHMHMYSYHGTTIQTRPSLPPQKGSQKGNGAVQYRHPGCQDLHPISAVFRDPLLVRASRILIEEYPWVCRTVRTVHTSVLYSYLYRYSWRSMEEQSVTRVPWVARTGTW